jgi:sugar/nucleoside kinase (ribokinase family)
MATGVPEIVVAGHICLDIIPNLDAELSKSERLFHPGRLVRIGAAEVSLGGCVANTGLALHRMGVATRLVGKVGDDVLGMLVLELLSRFAPQLCEQMIIAPGEATSYTIVLSPPDVDRSFLHCAGVNDSFSPNEVSVDKVAGAQIFHFGYPPLMDTVAMDGGIALAALLRHVQEMGVLTSLDMAMPDTSRVEQRMCWRSWLEQVLPLVDVFLPSFDEILFMLSPEEFLQLEDAASGTNLAAGADAALLDRLATELVEMGVPIVVIKLGDQGLYLRTSRTAAIRLSNRTLWNGVQTHHWDDLGVACPCLVVQTVGTTGAGDCSIAGFLTALLKGYSPMQALCAATMAGAMSVQSRDATSNIPDWSTIESMVNQVLPEEKTAVSFSR